MTMFFFNDTATAEIYALTLHGPLPICRAGASWVTRVRPIGSDADGESRVVGDAASPLGLRRGGTAGPRSEEHTSELQSRQYLLCRLLLEKKNAHAQARRLTVSGS